MKEKFAEGIRDVISTAVLDGISVGLSLRGYTGDEEEAVEIMVKNASMIADSLHGRIVELVGDATKEIYTYIMEEVGDTSRHSNDAGVPEDVELQDEIDVEDDGGADDEDTITLTKEEVQRILEDREEAANKISQLEKSLESAMAHALQYRDNPYNEALRNLACQILADVGSVVRPPANMDDILDVGEVKSAVVAILDDNKNDTGPVATALRELFYAAEHKEKSSGDDTTTEDAAVEEGQDG